eukprot:m.64464 g.64464  ORF g.64464 m.64464 type:complete len:106 (-) comp14002_c0_seq1:17-334(-)
MSTRFSRSSKHLLPTLETRRKQVVTQLWWPGEPLALGTAIYGQVKASYFCETWCILPWQYESPSATQAFPSVDLNKCVTLSDYCQHNSSTNEQAFITSNDALHTS